MGITMELNDLKLIALYHIKDSENLSNKDKVSLMDYVDNAGEREILFLLGTGCRAENFLEIEEEDGQAYRFREFVGTARLASLPVKIYKGVKILKAEPEDVKDEKPWGVSSTFLATTAVHAMVDSMLAKVKKGYMEKQGRKCDKETGDAKRSCYNKIRKDAIRAQIVSLNAMKVKCRNTNDEKKCLEKADTKIKELQTKMQNIKV